jgi:hypothetical protein
MKKYLFIGLSLVINLHSIFGQIKALTENGDEVVLFSDGSWLYKDSTEKTDKISVNVKENSQIFSKSTAANFLIKSKKNNYAFWVDKSKYSFKKAEGNLDAEYEIQIKDKDAYALIISEEIEVPLENLVNIALQNAQVLDPNMKVVEKEYRIVNGLKLLMMKMEGVYEGIPLVYFGYYHSSTNGTLQYISYTSQKLFQKYKIELETLLNGMVLLETK